MAISTSNSAQPDRHINGESGGVGGGGGKGPWILVIARGALGNDFG